MTMMDRKLEGRRTSSKLPELVELVMAKPLVSAGMVAKTLEVTPQAARRIVLELGLREMTGRGKFRPGVLSDPTTPSTQYGRESPLITDLLAHTFRHFSVRL
jgi:hypothetical protein